MNDDDEKLKAERERIRIASLKTRKKKKDEEEKIREENRKLKREKIELSTTLQQLEIVAEELQALLEDRQADLSKNEALEQELREYQKFSTACLLILQELKNDDEFKNERKQSFEETLVEVVRYAGEMSNLQIERILAESLDTPWKKLNINSSIPYLCESVKGKYRLLSDGTCEWRVDMAIPKVSAKEFTTKYRNYWEDPRPLMRIFKRLNGSWFNGLNENTNIDKLAEFGDTRLLRINTDPETSWAFVINYSDCHSSPKSTLLPNSLDDLPTFALNEKESKPISLNSSSSVRHYNNIGLVTCLTGTRATVIIDDSRAKEKNLCCFKGRFFESFKVWDENLDGISNTELRGHGARGVIIVSSSSDFSKQMFGDKGIHSLIDFHTDSITPIYQFLIDLLARTCGLFKQ